MPDRQMIEAIDDLLPALFDQCLLQQPQILHNLGIVALALKIREKMGGSDRCRAGALQA